MACSSLHKEVSNNLAAWCQHNAGSEVELCSLRDIINENTGDIISDEHKRVFSEGVWWFVQKGCLVPTIEDREQSNACIGFNRFFVTKDEEKIPARYF